MKDQPTGMSVMEWLGQSVWWVDTRSHQVVAISDMEESERLYAARFLMRHATAIISLAEVDIYVRGQLMDALELTSKNPRDWIQGTALYGALYQAHDPEPRRPSPMNAMTGRARRG